MTQPIYEFFGEYRFLSNFYQAGFWWQDFWWPHTEAAYQAAKSLDRSKWHAFTTMLPAEAKRAGKTIGLRSDWEDVKLRIMLEIVLEKFKQNPDLRQKLLATGNRHLEEGNTWGDRTWGVCPPRSGMGENYLGLVLMQVRDHLRNVKP